MRGVGAAFLGLWAIALCPIGAACAGDTQERLAANRYVATWKVRTAAEKKKAAEVARDKTKDEAAALKRSFPQPKEWWEEDLDKCARAPPRVDTLGRNAWACRRPGYALAHARVGWEVHSTLQGMLHQLAFSATLTQQWPDACPYFVTAPVETALSLPA